ncbi:MAG: hypothetical protein EOO90_21750 [Pedobacter sp.]|nr:MAG: hypothetical protein EOO90_21750 [Pedobacter sp.]
MIKKIFLLVGLFPALVFAQKPQLVIKNGLQSEIEMASISFDNKLGLTVENNETLILWELETGRQLQSFPNVMAADFALDHRSIDIVTKDYSFRTIDYAGNVLKQHAAPAAGNNRSNRLAMTFYRKSGIFLENGHIFSKEKGYLGRVLLNQDYGVEQDYSEKLNLLAIPSSHEVRLCKVPDASIVTVLKFNLFDNGDALNRINFTQFSSDGKYLLAGNDFSLAIVDITTGDNVYTYKYTDQNDKRILLNVASFSEDRGRLLILTSGHYLMVDLATQRELWKKPFSEFQINQYSLGVVKFSEDEKTAIIGYQKQLIFIDTETGTIKSKIFGITTKNIEHQQLSNNAKALFINQGEKLLDWNLNSGKLQKIFNFAPTSKLQIHSKATKFYEYWQEIDANTNISKEFQYQGRVDGINNLSLSCDDKFLLHTGRYEDKALENPYGINHDKLIVADVVTKKIIWRKNTVSLAIFSNKSNTIAAIDPYNGVSSIQLLNAVTGQLIRTLPLPNKMPGAHHLAFSPNDKYLTFDGVTQYIVYELNTNKVIEISKTAPSGDKIYGGQFLTNETEMVFSDYGGNLFFYNLAQQNWANNRTIKASENPIRSYSFTNDSRYLFTTGTESNVKLWDLKTLELLGTLYPNPSTGDWAIITPNGHFDASEGAQKEIYFVKGTNSFPLESLYEKYFTPSLLVRLLAGERFAPVDFDNLYKAPTIKMVYEQKSRNLSVDNDSKTYRNTTGIAEITITATAPEGKIDEIRLFHNGKVVTLTTRNLIVTDDNRSNVTTKLYTINLLSGTNNIRAVALNSQRTESNIEEMGVIYDSNGGNTPNSTPIKVGNEPIAQVDKAATLHLIVIGINAYQNNSMSLNYALADAIGFKTELEKNIKSVISSTKTYFIKDDEANKLGITNAFKAVQKSAKEQDVFVFYYAGHGVIGTDKQFYLVPSDVSNLKNVQSELVEKGIDAKMLQQYAIDIKAQKQLFILDACQSAGAFENMSSNGDQQKNIALVARSTGTHWMAASGSKQFANEFSSLGHGAFTYVLFAG